MSTMRKLCHSSAILHFSELCLAKRHWLVGSNLSNFCPDPKEFKATSWKKNAKKFSNVESAEH